MKTFIISLTLLIMSFSYAHSQIDSIWIGKSPEPCEGLYPFKNDPCWEQPEWIGPKTDTIVGSDADPSCLSSCYYVVVYYELIFDKKYSCYTPEEKAVFEEGYIKGSSVFISGYYWFGSDDCYDCPEPDLQKLFLLKYYENLAEENPTLLNHFTYETFVNTNGDTLRAYNNGFTISSFSKARCIDSSSGLGCNDYIERCCQDIVNVYCFPTDTSDRNVDSIGYYDVNENPLSPPCPLPCGLDCGAKKQSLMAGLSTCEIPCNVGTWTSTSSPPIKIDSLLTGCTDCEITIHYSYRFNNSETCPDNYRDARFDSVSYDCDPGCITQLSIEELTSYVNEWLLIYSLNDLNIGEIKDYYRLLNAVCVAGYDTLTQTALADCNPSAPYQLGCCWGRYTMYRVGDDEYIITKIDGTNQIGDTCEFYTRPCVPVCEGINNSIMTNPEDPYGEGSFEYLFRSMESFHKGESLVITSISDSKTLSEKIGFDNEIVIYDLFGKVRGNKKVLKTAFDDLEKGVYFITEKNKENVLKLYKIYIEK